MARGDITKSNIMLLRSCRGAKRAESGVSKILGTIQPADAERCGVAESRGKEVVEYSASCWVSHPRTGIYFPAGHDHQWVMEDVPEGAATFSQNCWFRNVDGVDNPNPDAHHPH